MCKTLAVEHLDNEVSSNREALERNTFLLRYTVRIPCVFALSRHAFWNSSGIGSISIKSTRRTTLAN